MEILKFELGKRKALLTCYLQEVSQALNGTDRRPAVLVLAGGGYEFVSDAEREPVALAYAAKGFQTFTLIYSVGENGVFPRPQEEALEAVAFIRTNCGKFHVDPDKIAVAGFSAGGHLAASVGVHWNDARVNPAGERELCRPNALVLVYPCITGEKEYAYPGIISVHGKGTQFPQLLSLENYVGAHTPPTFLCHTAADTCVPSMNSLLFAQALARAGVAYELHVFKEGPHGMSLATKAVSSPFLLTLDERIQRAVRDMCARFSEWFDKSAEFLRLVFEPTPIPAMPGGES